MALFASFAFAPTLVEAQRSQTHRFFGFAGDITIDDQPLRQGDVIVVSVDSKEIGRTTVGAAGAWLIEVDSSYTSARPCAVSFVVDGFEVDERWDTCPARVRVSLTRGSTEPAGEDTTQTDTSGEQTDQTEDSQETDDDAPVESEPAEPVDEEMMDEDEMDEDGSASDERDSDERQIVQPDTPRTGTGGLAEDSTNWASAAAITALLMFAVAAVALLIGRRTDSSA